MGDLSIYNSLLDSSPHNLISDAIVITYSKVNSILYDNIVCSISGGSDSDIMLDLVVKVDIDRKVKYVFFDTGLEYKATVDHLDELEKMYGIVIERKKAVKSVPLACRDYGVPFLSKHVSEMMSRLQKHSFKWEDMPYEELIKVYPNCTSALQWWCNLKTRRDGKVGTLNIDRDPYLKEFIIKNPPDFRISSKCCTYAKKRTSEKIIKDYNADLLLTGIRKSEGGIRSVNYKTCFTPASLFECAHYRPIFWFTKDVKSLYKDTFNVINSKCYSEYGLTRTGCAGCPFNKNFDDELERLKFYEPKFYVAVMNIFGKSYEYTRRYRDYKVSRNVNL